MDRCRHVAVVVPSNARRSRQRKVIERYNGFVAFCGYHAEQWCAQAMWLNGLSRLNKQTWHSARDITDRHTQTASCWLLKPICFSVKQQERETVAGLVVRNCGSLTLKYLEVTICTARVTFNNSTFCPHSVFMCFVWIWEQSAIISLYSINWLVCITEKECVYCAVRSGALYANGVYLVCTMLTWYISASTFSFFFKYFNKS